MKPRNPQWPSAGVGWAMSRQPSAKASNWTSAPRAAGLQKFLPLFVVYAAAVYFLLGLHRNKWRFTSVPASAAGPAAMLIATFSEK